jgi:formamidopyrimidine-DNA glycosylase
MPELPDITIYLEALQRRIHGRKLLRVRLNNPLLLRTYDPPLSIVENATVHDIRRLGKRIAIGLDDSLWLVIHLMIAGRLHWKPLAVKLSAKNHLAAFDFPNGSLLFSEAGSKRRASLHLLRGESELARQDPGGIDPLTCTFEQFASRLASEHHTIKRVLTNPHVISGIGNAYSDEILHRAKLSPFLIASKLDPRQTRCLFDATFSLLNEWIERLRHETGDHFPEHVTAFRPEMAVHGKFGRPCPVCAAPIHRIRYAEQKETNYCPRCQTQGRLLADRVLSRLLRDDRPKHLDELE